MPHTFSSIWLHIVIATKDRNPWLTPPVRSELFPYLRTIIGRQGGTVGAVGGVADHVHVLTRIRQDAAVAEIVRAVKANTSKWVNGRFPERPGFAWQTGYAVFSVSVSQLPRVTDYIAGQAEYHRRQSFAEELRIFLDRHGVGFDERDLQR